MGGYALVVRSDDCAMVKLGNDHGYDHVNDGQDIIGFQSCYLYYLYKVKRYKCDLLLLFLGGK